MAGYVSLGNTGVIGDKSQLMTSVKKGQQRWPNIIDFSVSVEEHNVKMQKKFRNVLYVLKLNVEMGIT